MGRAINDLVSMHDIESLLEIMAESNDWMDQVDAAEGLVRLGDRRGLQYLLFTLQSDDEEVHQVVQEVLDSAEVKRMREQIESEARYTYQKEVEKAKARLKKGRRVFVHKVIYLPVTIPAVLYGQNVTVEEMRVYYRSQNGTNSYIDETDLYAQTDADSWIQMRTDTNNHTSNTAASYTLAITQNNVLSTTQGAIGLFMYLNFANDTDYIQIGGVRLRLSHQ